MKLPLSDYLAARRAAIEAALERFLPAPPACPKIVGDAMRYSLFAGGKRLRPTLTLACADTVARHPDLARIIATRDADAVAALALPAACAVEMIHTYSLIHDDLPAMDDDTMRRGRPTLHVVYGEGMAVLGGDGLLTEAFSLLSREPAGDDPELMNRKLRVIGTIATAAGVAGMVGGQAMDLQATPGQALAEAVPASVADLGTLERIHACKTGALLRATCVAGAIMAGATEDLVAAVDRYAADLGLAFQIVDDILDVEGASEDLGKTAGKDAAAGKLTFPALIGLDASRARVRECTGRAHATLAAARLDTGYLGDILDWVACRTR